MKEDSRHHKPTLTKFRKIASNDINSKLSGEKHVSVGHSTFYSSFSQTYLCNSKNKILILITLFSSNSNPSTATLKKCTNIHLKYSFTTTHNQTHLTIKPTCNRNNTKFETFHLRTVNNQTRTSTKSKTLHLRALNNYIHN